MFDIEMYCNIVIVRPHLQTFLVKLLWFFNVNYEKKLKTWLNKILSIFPTNLDLFFIF